MKLRYGFVSNSSSSSFVIRGIIMKKVDMIKALEIDLNAADLEWKIMKGVKKPLVTYSNRDFFDGEETNEMLVGCELGQLDDGVVKRLPEPDDSVIERQLHEQLGAETQKLHTYVQYISNDNF